MRLIFCARRKHKTNVCVLCVAVTLPNPSKPKKNGNDDDPDGGCEAATESPQMSKSKKSSKSTKKTKKVKKVKSAKSKKVTWRRKSSGEEVDLVDAPPPMSMEDMTYINPPPADFSGVPFEDVVGDQLESHVKSHLDEYIDDDMTARVTAKIAETVEELIDKRWDHWMNSLKEYTSGFESHFNAEKSKLSEEAENISKSLDQKLLNFQAEIAHLKLVSVQPNLSMRLKDAPENLETATSSSTMEKQ